jgi:FecR protein
MNTEGDMMKKNSWFFRSGALLALASALVLTHSSSLRAQDSADDEIRQTVARVAYLSGDVSFNRGDDPENWQRVSLNFPMTLGDRVYTARDSRIELQASGTSIYVAPMTDLAAMNLRDDIQQYSISSGTVSLRVRRLRDDETLEIDTPNSAITIDAAGTYRIDVDEDGNTHVGVLKGKAFVSAGGGEVSLSSGDQMAIDGLDQPQYDVASIPRPDNWDRWVDGRAGRYRAIRSAEFVSDDVVGLADLDDNGRWDDIPTYGHVWSPSVSADWAPYRAGRWGWQDPWGWTWISDEPWGWAPYHYGRWVNTSSRWYWIPDRHGVRVSYAPALVAFMGGPRFTVGGGAIGWFPLGPRDPFNPWWGRQRRETSGARIVYSNQNFATVVNHDAFVTGRPVFSNVIRDRAIVRRVIEGPVVRGPLSIIPTTDSLRVSTGVNVAAPRPPDLFLQRPVVTRVAPPPAPPSFRVKEEVIRRNNGAPLTPTVSGRLSIDTRDGARAVSPIRPVVEGGIRLAPGSEAARTRDVRPVTPRPGRMLATPDRPIATDAGRGSARDVVRVAPGAVVTAPVSPAPAPRPAQPVGIDRRGAPSQPPSQPILAPSPAQPTDRSRDPQLDGRKPPERYVPPTRPAEQQPERVNPGPGEGAPPRPMRDAPPQPRPVEPRIAPPPTAAPVARPERIDRSPEVRTASPVTPREVARPAQPAERQREVARPAQPAERPREVARPAPPAERPREVARPAPEARPSRVAPPPKAEEKKKAEDKKKDENKKDQKD